ncbi:glycosyltransferase family 39 protein [Natrinema salifodinae]|uniref:Dolichyl-phosphate-mannose-protein mannosyltransferase n=1 Tax=Natrinema salifodinae TaxID=1202768 RepID=A0A1I0MKY1_9EURY|nr:glycosyltransferase family 39 protein [Natrinema salifodinae]SEV88984.1 Dolichyl-phosphate-mannose-protein mannosyltransferase [Natrinema salifodinae]
MSHSPTTDTDGEPPWKRSLRGVPIELVPIALLAAALRLFRLGSESYWLDEVVSVTLVTSNTPSELLVSVPGNDPHPPLYYLLLSGWAAIFGTSEVAARLLSALVGIATVLVLYALGRRLFDREVGAIAALFVAVSPFHIWYSQEVRMYNLLALLTALSFYWFVQLHRERPDEIGVRDDIVYVVSTVLLGYTHVFGLFAILAQNLYVFSRPVVRIAPRSRLTIRRWIALEGITALLLAPWLVRLFRRTMGASAGEPSNVSWIPLPTAETVSRTFAAYLGGYLLEESLPILVSLVVAGCLVLALSSGRVTAEGDRRVAPINGRYTVVLWFVVPILVPIAISHAVAPIFADRYSIGASLAFFLLIAIGVRTISRPSLRYVVVGILLVGLVLPLPTYYQEDQKEQWREAAVDVESTVDGDDAVLVSRPFAEEPFSYYFDRPNVTVDQVDPEASDDEIRAAVDGHDDVWIVLSYVDSSTSQRILQAVADRPDYRGPVEERRYNEIAVFRFERTASDG